MENKTWADVRAWADENDAQRRSDCGLFLRFARRAGLGGYGRGCGGFLATGTYFQPELYKRPTIDGLNAALINRAGVFAGDRFHDFDHLAVRESTAHSFYRGDTSLHPWEGRTEPIDPADGKRQASTAGPRARGTRFPARDRCRWRPVRSPAR